MTTRVLRGHVLDVLAGLPDRSVHVAVTSPPYWGLRAYGTPPQVWGAAEGCECEWGDVGVRSRRGQAAGASAQVGNTQKRVCPPDLPTGAFCRRCGAWRGELGSEPTLDLFVAHLVTVFEAVKRVMRDDATLWVNLGDSYSPDHAQTRSAGSKWARNEGAINRDVARSRDSRGPSDGLKAGDLCMAPARFALAMQAAGWRLRSEITLCKTAPMPESVQGARWEKCRTKLTNGSRNTGTRSVGANPAHGNRDVGSFESDEGRAEWADCPGCLRCEKTDGLVQRWGSGRPTSATEKLYVFAKGAGAYFYDVEATRQPHSPMTTDTAQRRRMIAAGKFSTEDEFAPRATGSKGGVGERMFHLNESGRNLWNYVMWSPEPLQVAHYAAYPRWLPRLAIQAGTSEAGVCPTCQAPWLRVVETKTDPKNLERFEGYRPRWDTAYETDKSKGDEHHSRPVSAIFADAMQKERSTVGWRQSCRCPAHQPAPATALDPFSGSGTTLIEANALGRHGIGVELQEKYVDIAHQRLSGQPLSLFAHEGQEEMAGGAEVDAPDTTKQEQHPNRTGLGLPPLVEARDRPVGVGADG